MQSNEIRKAFFDFFTEKGHKIVSSAPIIIKNDPTLMFTNAGMNQFKDIFLGNSISQSPRVADTQKCLRVSGKHNDLEEVGHDTYHHTMFEMLGNWSFGDYFKKEAIDWAWEFLVDRVKIDKERLYASVFEGNAAEKLDFDKESWECWKKYLPENHILKGSKKDNFWEMGDTGPCGPCSELHVDLRSDAERKKVTGDTLVNKGDPKVIEIWNLVFIQFNRKSNGELELLPNKHVDTGMGFERLCMAIQGKQSNYDTDIFQAIISSIASISGKAYGRDEKTDIAMRVVADHLRAVAFAIADGQIPSNNKAGYVIRRILRRAIRYGYTFLGLNEPFIYKLVPVLAKEMGQAFPELITQRELVGKVIMEEEHTFLRTLETGIRLLNQLVEKAKQEKRTKLDGKDAFGLYDTFGFPLDLTELMLRENGMKADREGFDKAMLEQKERSRSAAAVDTGDWVILDEARGGHFVGYDQVEAEVNILRYRKVSMKQKEMYQLVFDTTPFYAESGGQVGDTGYIESEGQIISILNTIRENDLVIHLSDKLPANPEETFRAVVDSTKRRLTGNNHSATHLLHKALRSVLGAHVEQKGSLVEPARLRFDFSHFQKLSKEELRKIEQLVNAEIRKNLPLEENRTMPMDDAKKLGAMALFGEKYGDTVRVVRFGDSIELCGGTHVPATGTIGFFKIVSESAIAAGIRRIEAITADEAERVIFAELDSLDTLKQLLNNPQDPAAMVQKLLDEKAQLDKEMEQARKEKLGGLKQDLLAKITAIKGINTLFAQVETSSAQSLKDLAYLVKGESDNLYLVLATVVDGKANLVVAISEELVKDKKLHAGNIIREIAKEVNGGGGGQAFFATAGGSKPEGIAAALEKAKSWLK